MKISRSRRVGGTRPSSRTKGAKPSGGGFAIEPRTEVRAAAAVSPAGPLTAVEGLLALQEVGRRNGARDRGLRRGHDILDKLDEIRHALLLGRISPQRLEAIARFVRCQRDQFDDPGLAAILDEIELRAEVELAKLSYLE